MLGAHLASDLSTHIQLSRLFVFVAPSPFHETLPEPVHRPSTMTATSPFLGMSQHTPFRNPTEFLYQLRQEHARLRHRCRSPQPSYNHDLWRYDPPWCSSSRLPRARFQGGREHEHRGRVRVVRRVCYRQDQRGAASGRRSPLVPWSRCMRRYVHVRTPVLVTMRVRCSSWLCVVRTRCQVCWKSLVCRCRTRLLRPLPTPRRSRSA